MRQEEFFISNSEEIKSGKIADVYFLRGKKVLEKLGINPVVYGEVTASSIPEKGPFGIFAGLEEALRLLEGLPLTVRAIPEGSLFYPGEPVFTVEGHYGDFGHLETALLGFLCFSSGISTKAARIKLRSLDKPVYSFGARRTHPAVVRATERAAFIGGCDGVATIAAAETIGANPVGTMAHAFVICVGNPEEAYRSFDAFLEEDVPRIALIDTFEDEKFGALTAANALKDRLYAVRLDTPSSRRGNFKKIIEEVRWELNLRGFEKVKIMVSGGIDERTVEELYDCVDGFGVGTAISNAPVVDFSFDIVEKEGVPLSKRGKKSGKKQVFECSECLAHELLPAVIQQVECSRCSRPMKPILKTYIEGGKRIVPEESPKESRRRTLSYLEKINKNKTC